MQVEKRWKGSLPWDVPPQILGMVIPHLWLQIRLFPAFPAAWIIFPPTIPERHRNPSPPRSHSHVPHHGSNSAEVGKDVQEHPIQLGSIPTERHIQEFSWIGVFVGNPGRSSSRYSRTILGFISPLSWRHFFLGTGWRWKLGKKSMLFADLGIREESKLPAEGNWKIQPGLDIPEPFLTLPSVERKRN